MRNNVLPMHVRTNGRSFSLDARPEADAVAATAVVADG